MTEINISHLMFTYDENPFRRHETYESFEAMLEWVVTHVGAHIEKNGFTHEVMHKGIGWEIRTKKSDSEKLNELSDRKFKVISWHMHIEDEQLATAFALKFVK